MSPPAGHAAAEVKRPVQLRMTAEEITVVDAFAAELSRRSLGANFSRAEVIRLACMAWLRTQAVPPVDVPGPAAPVEPVPPVEVPGGVSPLVDEPLPFVGDVAPVRAPSRSPTTKKKAKARKRPRSAALDTQVFAQVQTFGPCSCAAVQKALGIPNSTVYTSLVRLVEAGKLVKDGDTYRVVPTLQGA